ncbi:MAG: hypothetical protein ACJAT3_002770 [Akkermansiaceae bacterium]|jgi:hypothetical protein|tara:strand:- start:477 stop:656 length:180 start_codon:yes stop_codon:yes gene_type:complete
MQKIVRYAMMVRDPNTLIVGNHDLFSPTAPIIPSTVQPQKKIPSRQLVKNDLGLFNEIL